MPVSPLLDRGPRCGNGREVVLLAVDGGATSSKAALALCSSNGKMTLSASATGQGVNPNTRGVGAAREALSTLIARASSGYTVDAVCVGVAGSTALAREEVQRAFPGVPSMVASDVSIPALAALQDTARGVVSLVSGTGSIAARIGQGENEPSSCAGGWGWFLGDEGSGTALGRSAVRAVLQSLAGGPSTALTALLAEYFDCQGEDLQGRIFQETYGTGAPHVVVGALAPLVVRAHELEDPVASAICTAAAVSLASLVAKVHMEGDKVVVTGSVATALRPVLQPLLGKLTHSTEPIDFSQDAVVAAAREAARLLGIEADPSELKQSWEEELSDTQELCKTSVPDTAHGGAHT